MIFLTVGTQFPFDRLVKIVDELVGKNGFKSEVYGQIGNSAYQPDNFEAVVSLKKKVFDKHVRESTCIIAHAGMGTITMALENHKPLLVMPRLKKYNEVVNDHQLAIARKFEQLGHILVAYTEEQLPDKLRELKTFVPKPRENQAEIITARISKFLNEIRISKEQL